MAKILVADDEPEVIQFCKFILEKSNHTVISADSGPKTLEIIQNEKPDLLLLDIMLPGIDGYTIELRLSQNPVFKKLPVIIITALKPAQTLFDQFEQISGFLAKPFSSEDLETAVVKALGNSSSEKGKS